MSFCRGLTVNAVLSNSLTNDDPRGVLWMSSDYQMRVKIKTQKNPHGFQHNPKQSLDQKLTLKKKSHAEFLNLSNFQKGLNGINNLQHFIDDKAGR